MTRWSGLAGAALVAFATALGGGCALIVDFPDRTLGSTGGSGGGPPTYCQTLSPQPLFCDDFETHPLVPTWDHHPFANGSSDLSVDQAMPPGGHSFRAWFMAGGGDLPHNLGHISKTFQTTHASFHVGFDVYIDQFAAAPELTYLAELDLGDGHGALLYAVPGAPGVTTIQQRSSNPPALGDEINSSEALAAQTWTHVDIAFSIVAGMQSTLVLTIGTKTGIPKGDLHGEWTPGLPTIRLGDVVVNNDLARDVFYDNVVFDDR